MITSVLLVVALVCFLIGAVVPYPTAPNGPFYGRIGFVSLGLFFWVLSILMSGAHLAR